MTQSRRLTCVEDAAPATLPLDRGRAVAMAAVLTSLADPTHLQAFRAVADSRPHGASAADITASGGDRAVVRAALHQLEAVGLIRRRRDRPGRRYIVDDWTLRTFYALLGRPPGEPDGDRIADGQG